MIFALSTNVCMQKGTMLLNIISNNFEKRMLCFRDMGNIAEIFKGS